MCVEVSRRLNTPPSACAHAQEGCSPSCPSACVRVCVSYLDPNITVGSQGRVIQTRRGVFTDEPSEGRCRP